MTYLLTSWLCTWASSCRAPARFQIETEGKYCKNRVQSLRVLTGSHYVETFGFVPVHGFFFLVQPGQSETIRGCHFQHWTLDMKDNIYEGFDCTTRVPLPPFHSTCFCLHKFGHATHTQLRRSGLAFGEGLGALPMFRLCVHSAGCEAWPRSVR